MEKAVRRRLITYKKLVLSVKIPTKKHFGQKPQRIHGTPLFNIMIKNDVECELKQMVLFAGISALVALKKKRKKFSDSRNASPDPPPINQQPTKKVNHAFSFTISLILLQT